MSVRILLGIILAVTTGEAQASSLVFPGAPSSTPSVIQLGAPQQLQTADNAKSSDVKPAAGEAQPDVTFEKVAAVPDKPEARHAFQPGPMVIRGGVAGPDFPAPPTAAATDTAPATGTAPATATASAAPSGNAEEQPTPPSPPSRARGQRMPPNGTTK